MKRSALVFVGTATLALFVLGALRLSTWGRRPQHRHLSLLARQRSFRLLLRWLRRQLLGPIPAPGDCVVSDPQADTDHSSRYRCLADSQPDISARPVRYSSRNSSSGCCIGPESDSFAEPNSDRRSKGDRRPCRFTDRPTVSVQEGADCTSSKQVGQKGSL